jgi:hypothetical protein
VRDRNAGQARGAAGGAGGVGGGGLRQRAGVVDGDERVERPLRALDAVEQRRGEFDRRQRLRGERGGEFGDGSAGQARGGGGAWVVGGPRQGPGAFGVCPTLRSGE